MEWDRKDEDNGKKEEERGKGEGKGRANSALVNCWGQTPLADDLLLNNYWDFTLETCIQFWKYTDVKTPDHMVITIIMFAK